MKKIVIIFLLLLSEILFSCSKSDNASIEFDIDSNIVIELDEYDIYYNFSEYVKVYNNNKLVDYDELEFYCNSRIPKEGINEFTVQYYYDSVKYEEKFKVNFINSNINIKVYFGKNIKTYKVKNIQDLSLPEDYTVDNEKLNIEGYYLEEQYLNKFNNNTELKDDLTLYAKFNYTINYVPNNIIKSDVIVNLDNYINKLIDTTTSYIPSWNKEGFKGRWNYIDGVFLNSLINLYIDNNDLKYKKFFLNYINYYINENGDFINPKDLSSGFKDDELDSICESKILFDAYEMTNDIRYLKAIETSYQALVNMPKCQNSNNFWHKVSYENQIWLDGMYMYVPFLARYAKMKNDTDIFSLIKLQYEYIRNNMFDEEKKLYYHGHDTTKTIFWADKKTGNSQNFWLRSNGWFIVSLVDVLEYFPDGTDKEYLRNLLNEAITGLLNYQDELTKLFFQLIDKGNTAYYINDNYLNSLKNKTNKVIYKNYIESSGSAMIAYTLLKASRLNYISGEYKQIGNMIFERLYDYSFNNNSLNNICITAGLGPANNEYRDGSIAYYLAENVGSDDAKGVGPFIMAYIEYKK